MGGLLFGLRYIDKLYSWTAKFIKADAILLTLHEYKNGYGRNLSYLLKMLSDTLL